MKVPDLVKASNGQLYQRIEYEPELYVEAANIVHHWRQADKEYYDVGMLHGTKVSNAKNAKWWVRYGDAEWWEWVLSGKGTVKCNGSEHDQEDWPHALLPSTYNKDWAFVTPAPGDAPASDEEGEDNSSNEGDSSGTEVADDSSDEE